MTEHSVTICIEVLKNSNSPDYQHAAAEIWNRYAARLLGLARAKLQDRIKTREDEEDVVQEVFKSFCRRLDGGSFDIENRDCLLAVLLKMVEFKAGKVNRKHLAVKRDIKNEVIGQSDDEDRQNIIELLKSSEPNPEEAMQLVEMTENMVGMLPEKMREIAKSHLAGTSNRDIAKNMDVTVRTIERKIVLIRDIWQEHLLKSDSEGHPQAV